MDVSKTDHSIFIHPLAIVETEKIGPGTRIWGWTHVQKDAVIGEDCNIGEHCFLENGVRVGNKVVIKNGISLWEGTKISDNAFLGPHAVFTNERFPRCGFRKIYEPIIIEEGASIGAGAVVTPGINISRYATVGAGAVVTKDVPPHALFFGNPACFRGWMCVCGLKLKNAGMENLVVCECGRRYKVSSEKCQIVGVDSCIPG